MRLTMRSLFHMAAAATMIRTGVAARPQRISHLVLDFDETLTTHDTISTLTTAAYNLQSQRSPPPYLPPWSFFTESYLSDYDAHITSLPADSTRSTVPAELDYLSSLLPVERASIERIESYGVFSGISSTELSKAAATDVELREGWFSQVVKPALASGAKVSILSVNWSSGWIISALKAGAVREGGDESGLDGVTVICNDLVVDESGITTGKLTRWFENQNEGIWTAAEKKKALDEYLDCEDREDGDLAVYVGDSSTDLEAALGVDVGVYIGDKLVKTAERVGIELISVGRVSSYLRKKNAAKTPVLAKVESMEELGKFLGYSGDESDEE